MNAGREPTQVASMIRCATLALMPILSSCARHQSLTDPPPAPIIADTPAISPSAPATPAAPATPPTPTVVTERPPTPRMETAGTPPTPEHVWIPGVWEWQERWIWVPGRWAVRPRPGAVWISGKWVRRQSGWIWVRGYWR